MKRLSIICIFSIMLLSLNTACQKEELTFVSGDLQIDVTAGDHWLHDFRLFMGIDRKNPPQFAIWTEDLNGNYIETIYVTERIATESWIANGDNRRKEALPYWCHKRGVVYDDGLYLPTKDKPIADAFTGATPKTDAIFKCPSNAFELPVVIKAEFNQSTDFNDAWPKDAKESDANYSGGPEGSGQPAVVYSAILSSEDSCVTLKLTGHSSPDGTDGNLYSDVESLDTGLEIVKTITVTRK